MSVAEGLCLTYWLERERDGEGFRIIRKNLLESKAGGWKVLSRIDEGRNERTQRWLNLDHHHHT